MAEPGGEDQDSPWPQRKRPVLGISTVIATRVSGQPILHGYHLVNSHSYGKPGFIIGKSTVNGPFSIAMLNYQRVSMKNQKNP